MVFGTSTLGGLRGMGLRTWACSGFLRFTRSVYATWKSVNVRPQPDRLVHLHTAPCARGPGWTSPPRSACRKRVARCAERCGAVEPRREPAPLGELRVEAVHDLAAEEIAAPMPLVQHGRVIEERLDEVELGADQAAEPVHGLEHAREQAEPPACPPAR